MTAVQKFLESAKDYGVNVNEDYPIRMEDGDVYYLTEDDNCDRIILSRLPRNDNFDLMKDKIIRSLQMDIDEGLKSYPKCHIETLAFFCAYALKASNDVKGRS